VHLHAFEDGGHSLLVQLKERGELDATSRRLRLRARAA
jgi:hypothetical protein